MHRSLSNSLSYLQLERFEMLFLSIKLKLYKNYSTMLLPNSRVLVLCTWPAFIRYLWSLVPTAIKGGHYKRTARIQFVPPNPIRSKFLIGHPRKVDKSRLQPATFISCHFWRRRAKGIISDHMPSWRWEFDPARPKVWMILVCLFVVGLSLSI